MILFRCITTILLTGSTVLIGKTTSFILPNQISPSLVGSRSGRPSSWLSSSSNSERARQGGDDDTVSSNSSAFSVERLHFRPARLEDIPTCFEIESSSYAADEAASKESLKYRQKEATPYFRCASLSGDNSNDNGDGESEVIGFICSTRCETFEEDSMSTHDPDGKLLAIHSVVVKEQYRRMGVATAMMNDYIESVLNGSGGSSGIEKVVLIAKSNLLGFYADLGFQVTQPSAIVHGQDRWYDLEMDISKHAARTIVRSLPEEDETWFVKTEQFCKPFPVVKPHLEAHRAWVADLRSKGYCITSGYRVDSEGKPGGGGMMFFAAKSYKDAENLVLQDPLVANECVNWTLNGWIAEVGDVQMR